MYIGFHVRPVKWDRCTYSVAALQLCMQITCLQMAGTMPIQVDSFGPELKRAGYDGVIVSGVSDKPVYIYISMTEKLSLRDASKLWVKDSVETLEGSD